ncbi:hypothetical protein GCM10023340_35520 [Nocardioides marinquilinus]|uniref:Uncharacterized protein n=1 Tax=Nocardioides marinquilinus TaxID=1210400 RepID=A0ABP9PXX1_9ACTN
MVEVRGALATSLETSQGPRERPQRTLSLSKGLNATTDPNTQAPDRAPADPTAAGARSVAQRRNVMAGRCGGAGFKAAKNPVRGARPCNRRARKGDATKERALARAGGRTVADGAANTRRSDEGAEAQSDTAVEMSRSASTVDLSGPNDCAQGPCAPDP